MRHVTAHRFNPVRLIFKQGYAAFTCPCNMTVYYDKEVPSKDSALYKHESCHLMQIEREQCWRFSLNYLWYLAKDGYYNNPYEIEARAAESK